MWDTIIYDVLHCVLPCRALKAYILFSEKPLSKRGDRVA